MIQKHGFCVAYTMVWSFSDLSSRYQSIDSALRKLWFGAFQTSANDIKTIILHCMCYGLALFRRQQTIPKQISFIAYTMVWSSVALSRCHHNSDYTLHVLSFGTFETSADDTKILILLCVYYGFQLFRTQHMLPKH